MNWTLPKVYAVKHNDEDVVANSRSGGVFTALSDYILHDNGVIYGCVMTDHYNASHVRADNENIRDLMRGSKYIQSKLGDTLKCVKNDLESGKEVLFSGTSCQVAGLKSFLGKDYEKLYCVDIVCHGVPSQLVWKEYLKWQERRNKSKIKQINFRNKEMHGWESHYETILFEDGHIISSGIYRNLFYRHNVLRPSCYKCPFKSVMHPGDITIADYWGIEKAAPEFNDNKGASLVLVNGEKGQKLFESISNTIRYKETKIEDSLQPPLISAYPAPVERKRFWRDFQRRSFGYVVLKYGSDGYIYKINKKLNKIREKFVKK